MMRPGDRTCALACLIAAAAASGAFVDRSAAQPSAVAQATPELKRGDVLPEAYRSQVVTDYQRWRLRRPPEGYAWYRVGAQFVLASMTTGVIFDVVEAG
jgi:Ni/Co efflux regulator RcnB